MIEAQKKVIDRCDVLAEKVKAASVSVNVAEKLSALVNNARDAKFVVPVVGAFSSGKSSMINSLLGENILPVAITPETSLATELHYSPKTFIEAVKNNGEVDRYELEEITTVTANAAQYMYARLYLNNARIREIEPLVLVDMPGFDSPLDLHNKAIMAYLERGCYYIVLSSVEEGTISKSLERRLQEIDGFGREFSFFLTKADLRPAEALRQLVNYYQKQIDDNFDSNTQVVPFQSKSVDEVMKCLKDIDVNKITIKHYRDFILDICNDIITDINLKISASKKNAEALRIAIKEMENSIAKLQSKSDSEADTMWQRYSGGMINDIVADVGKALDNATEELVSAAKSGNQDALNERLNEIVRSALVLSVRENIGEINQQINNDFSASLSGLDKIMKDLDIDDNYIRDLSSRVQSAIDIISKTLTTASTTVAAAGTATTLTKLGGATAIGGSGAVVAALSGVAIGGIALGPIAAVALPIVGAVMLFCPEIISGIMKGQAEKKVAEAVRAKLAGEVYPAIKRKIREEIPQKLEEQVKKMIDGVREKYAEMIKGESETINAQIAEKNESADETETKRAELDTIRTDVQAVATEVLAWGK